MELLKQPLGHPMSMAEQVITLVSANAHIFSDMETSKVKELQALLLADFHTNHNDLINQLETTKALGDDVKEAIVNAAKEFKTNYIAENAGAQTESETEA